MILAMYSIFVFILIGYVAKVFRLVGNKQSGILLGFLLNFALPAQVFNGTYHAEINLSFLFMCLIALLCNIVSACFLLIIGRIFGISKDNIIVLCLMGMLGNTLYLGLPIIKGTLGSDYANQVVIYDQFVTGIPFAFLAPIILSLGGKGKFSFRAVIVRLCKSPLFLSLICGFAFRLIPFKIPTELFVPLQSLAQTATPVALFAIGVQLDLKGILDWKLPALLLSGKMILAPLIIYIYIYIMESAFSNQWRMILLEVAMPPLISGVALSIKAKLNVRLALNSVTFGLFVSFATIPIWIYLMNIM